MTKVSRRTIPAIHVVRLSDNVRNNGMVDWAKLGDEGYELSDRVMGYLANLTPRYITVLHAHADVDMIDISVEFDDHEACDAFYSWVKLTYG